jgi:F-type H+-transporting ATPase subunit gamma
MPTLRQLRDRVKSLKNTQQITRAMKMVAGARIRRAELAMKAARPYAGAIGEMLRELAATGGASHPLLAERPDGRPAILLMTADKGLCGAFNSNLVRAALNVAARSSSPSRLYLVGTKGRVQLRKTPHPVEQAWPLGGKPFADLAAEIATVVMDDFLAGKVDGVTLVSSRLISTINQRPTPVRLLPLERDPGAASRGANKNSFEFEPDGAAVLAALLPKYVEFTIFQALLETQASEFAAKLLAMTNATDNAGKLIDELTLVMNKTRQAAITKEILEIVGGAEALKG